MHSDAASVSDTPDLVDQLEEVQEQRRARKPISVKLATGACPVCKQRGHRAGFVGAVYVDCPNKPCYLCKTPGHSTSTCPYRAVPAARLSTGGKVLAQLMSRELGSSRMVGWLHRRSAWGVTDVASKVHDRRVSVLAFHPRQPHVLISGDKFGKLVLWEYGKPDPATSAMVLPVHKYIINAMQFQSLDDHTLYTASSDGTLRVTDLETQVSKQLLDLNPNGYVSDAMWRMLTSLEHVPACGAVLAGDDVGQVFMLDPRDSHAVRHRVQMHRKDKITSLHAHPRLPHLMLSAGTDHTMRLWDLRKLAEGATLATVQHPRMVTAAYFSPLTGNKIVSTCTDNRLRVWDNLYAGVEAPTREIVHSQDFNRYLTPFRAVWDPKDWHERLLCCGRYISDDVSGLALHPVDLIDADTGVLVNELTDPVLQTISPVNVLHPSQDIIASGSSRSLYVWRRCQDGACDTDAAMAVGRVAASAGPEADEDLHEERLRVASAAAVKRRGKGVAQAKSKPKPEPKPEPKAKPKPRRAKPSVGASEKSRGKAAGQKQPAKRTDSVPPAPAQQGSSASVAAAALTASEATTTAAPARRNAKRPATAPPTGERAPQRARPRRAQAAVPASDSEDAAPQLSSPYFSSDAIAGDAAAAEASVGRRMPHRKTRPTTLAEPASSDESDGASESDASVGSDSDE